PPEPSEQERSWLYDVFRTEVPDDDLLVLETEIWVRKIRMPEYRDFLVLYHQALEKLNTGELNPAMSNTDCYTYWDGKRIGIAYLYRPDLNRLFLLEPLRDTDDVNSRLQEHRERLSKASDKRHGLLRIAGRSYPFLMVLDQNAWLAIEKDEEANLALSPEE